MATPDELHEQYFEAFPDGDKLSVFAQAQRFMNEQKELNERFVRIEHFEEKLEDVDKKIENVKEFLLEKIKTLKDAVDGLLSEIKSKVNVSDFYWIIGVLMAIVIGLFGTIYLKMEKIDESQNITKNSVSNIQGLLQGAEIIK